MNDGNFISPKSLAALLSRDTASLSILDASWYLPAQNRDGREEFRQARIPGAQYFDIDQLSDRTSTLPHMMLTAEQFGEQVGRLGVGKHDRIIVYDGPGIFSSARAWWMFRVMGARNVQLLEGGFDRWKAAGMPVETGPPKQPRPNTFNAVFDKDNVCGIDAVRANMTRGEARVLDARPFGRFAGETPEPRPGLRSGHIPGSTSLPFDRLLADGCLKEPQELTSLFEGLGIDKNTEVIATCGSGVTAAVISLALDTIGHRRHSLYDGSWAEWGQAENAPIETGNT